MQRIKRLFKKPKRLLLRFLLSYLVVLLLPISFNLYANYQASNIIKEEISKSHMEMLEQTRLQVDTLLTEAYNTALHISGNETVNNFLQRRRPFTNTDHYNMYRITQDLLTFTGQNPLIYDIYIYFFNSNTVLRANAVYTDSLFYDTRVSHAEMDFEQWRRWMRTDANKGRSILVYDIVVDGTEMPGLELMQALPITSIGNPSGQLVVMLDERALMDTLVTDSNSYIIDANNQIITHSNMTPELPILTVEELDNSDDLNSTHYGGQDLMVTFIHSKVSGWRYVNIEYEDVYLAKAHTLRDISLVVVLTCGFLGIILSWVLAKSSYSPINGMVEFIASSSLNVDASPPPKGEYEFIHQAIIGALNNNVRLEEELGRLSSEVSRHEEKDRLINSGFVSVSENIIGSLLLGNIGDPTALRELLEFYGLSMPSHRFTVMLIQIDDASRFIRSSSEQDDWRILRFAIRSVIEELINDVHSGYTAKLGSKRIGVLVCLDEGSSEGQAMEEVKDAALRLCDFIEENFMTELSVGIGTICDSLETANVAYANANTALDFRIINKQQSVVEYQGIAEQEKDYYYPIAMELQLINCLKTGDIVGCNRLLADILEENFVKRALPVRMLEYVTFNIVGTALRTMSSMDIDPNDVFEGKLDLLNHMATPTTSGTAHQYILSTYETLCLYISSQREKAENSEIKEKALSYIHEHFIDATFSQTLMADELKLSATYMSRVFKRETGYSMLEYVNRLRIEKAKQLLSTTDASLPVIADAVGFTSDKTLIRVFKQYEGITPGHYRNLNSHTP